MPDETSTQDPVEQLNTLWNRDIKALKARAEDEGKTLKALVDSDALVREQVKRINDRMDEVETKMARPAHAAVEGAEAMTPQLKDLWAYYFGKDNQPAPMAEVTPERIAEAKTAFRAWLRKGEGQLAPEQVKALSTQVAADGGFLVYPEFAGEVIKDLTEISPVRQIARVSRTASNVWKAPKRTGLPTAAWVGEGDTDSDTQASYGLVEMPNGTMRATSRATREMLDDAAFDMEMQMREDFQESFGAAEGAAFVNGNGVLKPEGFMQDANVDGSSKTGSTSAITLSGLVDVSHGLNSMYLGNARFVFRLTTLGQIRIIEDTSGHLIFLPATSGAPSTILGFPYTILQDMPAMASGAYPVAFGDFRRGYHIKDRVVFDLLRDPFSAKKQGAIEFTAFLRVGGQVVLASAIRKLQQAT